jgi:hypothetical protein
MLLQWLLTLVILSRFLITVKKKEVRNSKRLLRSTTRKVPLIILSVFILSPFESMQSVLVLSLLLQSEECFALKKDKDWQLLGQTTSTNLSAQNIWRCWSVCSIENITLCPSIFSLSDVCVCCVCFWYVYSVSMRCICWLKRVMTQEQKRMDKWRDVIILFRDIYLGMRCESTQFAVQEQQWVTTESKQQQRNTDDLK